MHANLDQGLGLDTAGDLRPAQRSGTHDRFFFFAVSVVAHTADHFRRGLDTITTELLVAGSLGLLISALVILLVLLRHRRAPQMAIVAGVVLPVGFIAAHWLPTWSVFSDSFVSGDASALSQAASLFEIVGALVLGAAGLYALRRARSRLADGACLAK